MQAPASSNKPRIICPRGTHLCRCVQVIDLGTQHFQPGDDGSRKIYFAFETCTQRHTFDEKRGPEPFMLQIEFAFFMGRAAKPTKLRKFVEGWFGKAFTTDDEASKFDFAKLLNRAAQITVAHQPKKDGTMKSVIADIFLPEPGTTVPPAHNPLLCYEIAEGQDATFAKLPNFLKVKIAESDEFSGVNEPATSEERSASHEETTETATPARAPQKQPEEEDVPF